MGWASRVGRARVNATNPQAQAVCDRCGIWYNLVDLQWQFDWTGAALQNLRILVCRTCLDVPQEQLRALILPADPVPKQNPRIEYFANAETNYLVTSGQNTIDPITGIPVICGEVLQTQDGQCLVTQQTGEPPHGLNTQPGTDPNAPGNSNPGLPYNNTQVPKTGILVP